LENLEARDLPGGSRVEFGEFDAPSLRKPSNYSVFLPPSYKKDDSDFPVVYFLHGRFNDHTSWVVERYGDIPGLLEGLMLEKKVPEFIVVQPDGENSFYTDYLDGSMKYEQLVVKDLIDEVEWKYKVRKGRNWRAIGGVSMGAYGALKIAMKYPELYSSVAGVSPIVLLGDDPSAQIMGARSRLAQFLAQALEPVFGIPFDQTHWEANSLEKLAKNADLDELKVFFAYGTADRYARSFPMEAGVRGLSRLLTERDKAHELKIYENGPHGWQLVVDHIEDVTSFLSQSFRQD
jgi:enterochelin esterase family protein